MNSNHRKGEDGLRQSVEDIVINWHLTEACNYRCHYCYSTWGAPNESTELHRDSGKTLRLLSELWKFFDPKNVANPLRKSMVWQSVRLSIAGGEPTLLNGRLELIVAEAKRLGFKVSLITNGSLLDEEKIATLAPSISSLGISMDSLNFHTNHLIGRTNRQGQSITVDDLAKIVETARHFNSKVSIKLNTVVNAANATEDMTSMIKIIAPDRWKVLRVLPVISNVLTITDSQFRAFIDRHQQLSAILSAEDNQDMTESYIMVDPYGRFFQNSSLTSNPSYIYSSPLLDVGAETAFSEINFVPEKFVGRYRSTNIGKVNDEIRE